MSAGKVDVLAVLTAARKCVEKETGVYEAYGAVERLINAAQGVLDDDDSRTTLADQRARWEGRLAELNAALAGVKGAAAANPGGNADAPPEQTPLEVLFALAAHVGAEIDGGDDGYPDHPSVPACVTFTDRELETFVGKILDGSWLYKGFERDAIAKVQP